MSSTLPNGWITPLTGYDESGNLIGGVPLPPPAVGSGGLTISSLVDSGQNAKGNFLGTVIGDDKLRYEISFSSLSNEDFNRFLLLFDHNRGGHFVQEFWVFDPRVNDFVAMEMYVGDRTGRPLALDSNFRPTRWMDVAASLTQV